MKIAIDNIQNWIFVTGVIRSGTTFVGKVLSIPLEVDYIHEPFHGGYIASSNETLSPKYVRPGLTTEDASEYYRQVSHLFRYDINMKSARYDKDPLTRKVIKYVMGSRGPFYLRLAKMSPFHKAAVIKDPIGKLVTEYLYLTFGVKPVIVVKHPVSLIASLKRLGWWPEMYEFTRQKHIIEDYFSDDVDFVQRKWPSRLLESAAHWRACYKVLLTQAKKYPDWQVVTLEELSRQPSSVFRCLYDELGLPWSGRVERKIRQLTQGNASARARNGRVQDFRRNSADIFETYRDSVPREERQAIFEIVQDVALPIYSRESFAIDPEP